MTPERDLLTFYAEAGVDALLGEHPVDRFAAVESAAPPDALSGTLRRQIPRSRPA